MAVLRLLAPLVIAVFAGAAIWRSSLYGVWKHSAPGAGLFPLLTSCGLLFFALLWLYDRAVSKDPLAALPEGVAMLRVGLQLAALVLFALVLDPLGYVAVAIGLAIITAVIAGEKNWGWMIVVALLAGFGVKYFFTALGTPL
jgi:hypothetical protein